MNTTPTPPPPPAWDEQKLLDPHSVPDKARRVREMFAAIARSYDLNNRIHSLGRDQAWRRRTVELCHVKTTDTVIDIACGTGDLAMAFAKRRPRQIIGLDFTHPMLQVAQHKLTDSRTPARAPIDYADGDAMRLPVRDAAADVVSIAFGIRNVTDPAKAIGEFYRILRPGGRVAILEFSLPRNRLLRSLYNFYFKNILPLTATWISRDKSGAYKYLPQSVNTFIDRSEMTSLLTRTGFVGVALHRLTFGIAVIYIGRKPLQRDTSRGR